MPTPREIGYQRDKNILDLVEELGALDTYQIASLYFRSKSGIRAAERSLTRLYKSKRIKRIRLSIDSPAIYYYKRSGRLEHLIAANWIYVYMKVRRELREWWPEEPLGILQADAIARAAGGWYFIEMDLAESRNPWDKVKKYNLLYEEHGRPGSELYKRLGEPRAWPAVFVVTTNKERADRIRSKIAKENKHGLRWEIVLLDQIKREAML